MNFGFNSNVRVGEATYHVQTEDRGASHPFLDTVVYLSGRVVYKRSTGYARFASGMEAGDLAQKLREHLVQQHREVIAELEAGTLAMHAKHTGQLVAADAEERDGLDLRLLNSKTWFAAGNVILEIELCEKITRRGIENADVQACLEHAKQRIPCAELRTDAEGCATLKFSMPRNVRVGTSLVVRATDGTRYTELRFRLKSRSMEKAPAPVA